MDNLNIGRPYVPITTGAASPYQSGGSTSTAQDTQPSVSFKELLAQQLEVSGVEFSKHAMTRVEQRSIQLDENRLERLNEGVKMAQEKGLDEALILIDRTAFIVSAQNNKVITTVGEEEMKGNVFTNIEGTVIV